ncbi:glycoside hydrolase family 43 protein [Neobacillus niacini]|uniref:glycoside hydrolase family 43 protein n=1 Tax=Neobacillus niacini TaxID=86668 RepID=UPI002FFE55BB
MVYLVGNKGIKVSMSILLIASLLFSVIPSMTNANEMNQNSTGVPIYDSIQPGVDWTDTEGNLIEAHGGSVQKLNEKEIDFDVDGDGNLTKDFWFWYGEDKTSATRPVEGVKAYVSEDLYNWKDMGTVLRMHDKLPVKVSSSGKELEYNAASILELIEWGNLTEPTGDVTQAQITMAKDFLEAYVTKWADTENRIAEEYDEANLRLAFENLYGRYNITERPKMLYNKQTGKFVIAYHADGPTYLNSTLVDWVKNGARPEDNNTGSRYGKALMAFAESETPFGPFKLVNATRMNWTEGVTPSDRYGESRDYTVFVDYGKDVNNDNVDDAYAVYSSEMNAEMYVSLLNSEYTGPAVADGDAVPGTHYNYRALPDQHREASSVFFYNGYYYMLTSGTDGWNSTNVIYYRSKSMILPVGEKWERVGDPFAEEGTKGYDSQPTSIITVDAEKGQFIYMGDRWRISSNGSAGPNSRYVWLPIQVSMNNTINIEYYDRWNPTNEWLYYNVTINTEIPERVLVGEIPNLPSTVNVTTTKDTTFDTPVEWSYNPEDFTKKGTVVVEATFPEIRNKIVRLEMQVVPPLDLGEVELNSDVFLYGNQYSLITSVDNNTDSTKTVTVNANTPSGWNSAPVTVQLESMENKEVTIPVNPPGAGDPGLFKLAVSASDDRNTIEKEVEILAVPKAEDLVYAFDAGTASSSVFEQYKRLSPLEKWDAEKGYGWIGTVPDSRDRGVVDFLRRDFIGNFNPATLGLTIPAGYHTVYVLSGDRQFSQNTTVITVDGTTVAETGGTAAGEYKMMPFVVNGGENGKTVELQFSGNSKNHWIFNSVMVLEGIPTSVDKMISLLESFQTDGKFANNGAGQSLQSQLNSVGHFEKKGELEKALHHLNNFKQLLDQHKKQELISEKAYGILNANVTYLVKKWN